MSIVIHLVPFFFKFLQIHLRGMSMAMQSLLPKEIIKMAKEEIETNHFLIVTTRFKLYTDIFFLKHKTFLTITTRFESYTNGHNPPVQVVILWHIHHLRKIFVYKKSVPKDIIPTKGHPIQTGITVGVSSMDQPSNLVWSKVPHPYGSIMTAVSIVVGLQFTEKNNL